MKTTLSILTALSLLICSQTVAQKGINGLINAEKAFASFTQSHTIREGFLQYMDSAGLVFRQGSPVNAIETYQKQKPGPAILSWAPGFALISASGDMGVTTGPYSLRPNALKDTPVARGSFSSVWQINKQGIWKNMVDLGVSYSETFPAVKKVKAIVLDQQTGASAYGFKDVLLLDTKLNKAISDKNVAAIASYLAKESWLNIEGQQPLTGNQQVIDGILGIPFPVSLTTLAVNISGAGDFAYAYGTVSNSTQKENYLRVWIRRNKQWQVILQTIKW